MIINENLVKNVIPFERVNPGDVFKYENKVYIKGHVAIRSSSMFNAFNLTNNTITEFCYKTLVQVVQAELNITKSVDSA